MVRLTREMRALEDLGLDVVGFEAVLVVRAHRRKACCWNLRTDSTPSLLFHRQRLDWARFAVERMTTIWHKALIWFSADMKFICWEIDDLVLVPTPIFPVSGSFHGTPRTLEH